MKPNVRGLVPIRSKTILPIATETAEEDFKLLQDIVDIVVAEARPTFSTLWSMYLRKAL
jgi:hypothetical protein